MQLHFCNSFISLKNTIKNYEKNISVFLMPFYAIIASFKFFRRWIHYSCSTGLNVSPMLFYKNYRFKY